MRKPTKEPKLLTRDEFRSAVFERDGHRCVMCKRIDLPVDAHHIMERRLFPDGGYYLDNGATLCDPYCHMTAEETEFSTDYIRQHAGITNVILPPHLYSDERYDKWGNPYLSNGLRMRGELFDDQSVQEVLTKSIINGEFTEYVKYPRTYHFPFSPGISKDDRVMDMSRSYINDGAQVVITEKRDGENTTMYRNYIHARSVDYKPHPSRDFVKSIWANKVAYQLPEGWRVCGENLFAKHSVGYDNLQGYLEVFSVWNSHNQCLPWDETIEWASLLELPLVPILYRGPFHETEIMTLAEDIVKSGGEGIVVRVDRRFAYSEFRYAVGKYVRKNHIQTHGHWMRMRLEPNKLADAQS